MGRKNTSPDFKASPIHELVVPTKHKPRLNDLDINQEKSIWGLAQNRCNKILNRKEARSATIIINDGIPAGQTVGHAHIHVMGLNNQNLINDLELHFNTLTRKFCKLPARPIASKEFESDSILNIFEPIRSYREQCYIGYGDKIGFSIYTNEQITTPLDPCKMTVQIWHPNSPRPYGLANLIRVLNGYKEEPRSWPVKHLSQHFTPE